MKKCILAMALASLSSTAMANTTTTAVGGETLTEVKKMKHKVLPFCSFEWSGATDIPLVGTDETDAAALSDKLVTLKAKSNSNASFGNLDEVITISNVRHGENDLSVDNFDVRMYFNGSHFDMSTGGYTFHNGAPMKFAMIKKGSTKSSLSSMAVGDYSADVTFSLVCQ